MGVGVCGCLGVQKGGVCSVLRLKCKLNALKGTWLLSWLHGILQKSAVFWSWFSQGDRNKSNQLLLYPKRVAVLLGPLHGSCVCHIQYTRTHKHIHIYTHTQVHPLQWVSKDPSLALTTGPVHAAMQCSRSFVQPQGTLAS